MVSPPSSPSRTRQRAHMERGLSRCCQARAEAVLRGHKRGGPRCQSWNLDRYLEAHSLIISKKPEPMGKMSGVVGIRAGHVTTSRGALEGPLCADFLCPVTQSLTV